MNNTAYKTEINKTFTRVRDFSFKEKKEPVFNEKKINAFLDAILSFKEKLKDQTEIIDEINESIEKITWFTDLDDECLIKVNDLIAALKDLHSSLIRQYVTLDSIRKQGIAKEETKEFKNAIDELKESYQDLESVFFFLPNMPDFVETTKMISIV